MKNINLHFVFFLSILLAQPLLAQNWIPFQWHGDSIENKYFDKLAIVVPVKIDNLPYNFGMQLDLGAVETMFYEKNISEILSTHPDLKQKIDTTSTFWINNSINPMMKNINLNLGNIDLGLRNIGLYKNFGTTTKIDATTEKPILIGTIAPDIFKNKILIIDYPNNRLSIQDSIPNTLEKASFSNFEQQNGRIFIHFQINGHDERLMFDTGSSMFSLITTPIRARKIANRKTTDKFTVNSWGKPLVIYEKTIDKEITFGSNRINSSKVYYSKNFNFKLLYFMLKIWGITGNANFLHNVIIIDYKNQKFGVY